MNPALAGASVAALALVAAAGVVAGFRRREPVPVEPVADPLEDRRLALLRSLDDLDEAHVSEVLDDEDYGRLRLDTEGRMARLERAIDERRVRDSAEREAEATPAVAAPARAPGRVPTWAVATLLVATVGAVLVAGLARNAEPSATASGSISGTADPLAFFERRVRDHPNDLAARLDLAQRYLDAGMVQDSLAQYGAVLEIDPDDAEARAKIGLILYLAGQSQEALASVDRALQTSPDYPEALFYRGVILLRGLDRPADAIEALQRYLDVAPFGTERATAQRLIDRARAELEGDEP